MTARLAKIAVTFSIGVIIFLAGLDNVLDYGTNFDAVQHILSMDMVPPSPLKWRAITSPTLHHLFYAVIIGSELASGVLTLYGAWLLWKVRGATGVLFNSAKSMAVAGLCVGFVLYAFGFLAVGGEWFQMWRAGVYALQEPAFRFLASLGLTMIFLSLPDMDLT